MKNNNLTKIAKGLLALALLSTLVACGKKTDNNNQNLNAFTQNCINCVDNGITGFPFFSSQSQAYKPSYYGYGYTNAMTLNLSFSGQNINAQAQAQDNNNQFVSPAMNYVGKVSAAGQVNVAAVLNLGFCPAVPAGQYNLSTQTVGQWSKGAISGLRMLISGPVTMTAVINQAQAYEYGYSQYSNNSRVYGQIVIEQVNGYFCQGATLQLN
jgi:hypothetical protein